MQVDQTIASCEDTLKKNYIFQKVNIKNLIQNNSSKAKQFKFHVSRKNLILFATLVNNNQK